MKKIVFLLSIIILTSFTLHKYYISVTEVYLDKDKHQLELIMRVFPDDLEFAIKEEFSIEADLSEAKTQSLLNDYLHQKLKIVVDDKKVDYQIIKQGMQDEFYTILIQAPFQGIAKKIVLKNVVLQEIYDEQKNIVHFFINKNKQSFILVKGDAVAHLQVD